MIRKNLFKASLVSILLMCVSYTWAYDFEEGNFYYTVTSLEDMTAELSGLVDSDVSEVMIPETTEYKGRKLTITSIGESAFASNKTLKTITIPSTITEIGNKAFYYCSALTEIELPESILYLGTYAFYGSGITSITFPRSMTSIPAYSCYYCKSLSEINWPSSLKSIGSYAFAKCTALKVLDIPNSVTELENHAFCDCTELDTLYVGTSLKYLLDYTTYKNKNNPLSNADTYYEYFPLFWDNGPSKINCIIKDSSSEFSIRGYSYCWYEYGSSQGHSLFSNIDVQYFYIGRPLTDIESWNYSGHTYNVSGGQPYGTIQILEIGGYCTEVPFFHQSVQYLILGEDVNTYTISNIYQGNMKGIICRSATPPTLDSTFEISTYVNVVLYVPSGSKSAYQSAAGWSDFWDIVELDTMPPGYTAIEDIATNAQTEVREIYTINGQRLNSPQRGINILRYSDGTTKKVLAK